MHQTSGSLKGHGYRRINPTFLKSTSDRECCAQCKSEQTEKQETSSILTDSRQTTRESMSANMCDFVMHPGGPAASWASIEPRVLIAPVPTTMIVIPKTILSVYRQLEVDPPSMQAMRARGFNGYGDLKLVSLPKPEVSNGEVVLPRQNHWRSGNSLAASLIGMSSSRKRELGKYRLRHESQPLERMYGQVHKTRNIDWRRCVISTQFIAGRSNFEINCRLTNAD